MLVQAYSFPTRLPILVDQAFHYPDEGVRRNLQEALQGYLRKLQAPSPEPWLQQLSASTGTLIEPFNLVDLDRQTAAFWISFAFCELIALPTLRVCRSGVANKDSGVELRSDGGEPVFRESFAFPLPRHDKPDSFYWAPGLRPVSGHLQGLLGDKSRAKLKLDARKMEIVLAPAESINRHRFEQEARFLPQGLSPISLGLEVRVTDNEVSLSTTTTESLMRLDALVTTRAVLHSAESRLWVQLEDVGDAGSKALDLFQPPTSDSLATWQSIPMKNLPALELPDECFRHQSLAIDTLFL